MNDDLQLALELADVSDAITLRHFRSAFAVRTKSDRTPVTEVDEAVERAIRERLASERPDDAVIGEELGSKGDASRRWIIDPIDGTANFIRGIPIFATLIALDGAVGVISAPALGRRWHGVHGGGAFCNGRPIRASSIQSLREAQIGYDSITDFESAGVSEKFLALVRRCGRARGFGDFWTHMLVAEGAMEIAVEPKVAWWDMAAVQIIVDEAGGRFSALDGRRTANAGSGLSTNALLHEEVLTALR